MKLSHKPVRHVHFADEEEQSMPAFDAGDGKSESAAPKASFRKPQAQQSVSSSSSSSASSSSSSSSSSTAHPMDLTAQDQPSLPKVKVEQQQVVKMEIDSCGSETTPIVLD